MSSPRLKLGAHEICATGNALVVEAVISDGVAICLYAEEGQGGGAHHALASETRSTDALLDILVHELGLPVASLRAKLVSGPESKQAAANIREARRALGRRGIAIIAEATGGEFARQIIFHLPSGRLQVATMPHRARPALGRNERSSSSRATSGTKTPAHKTPAGSPAAPAVVPPRRRMRVLVVDDSRSVRDLLAGVFTRDPSLEVVGVAESAAAARPLLAQLRPDVMTLDIHMPGEDGLSLLENVMKHAPLPVVMISALSAEDGPHVLRALELGAVDYVQKPRLRDLASLGRSLCETVYTAAASRTRSDASSSPDKSPKAISRSTTAIDTSRRIIAIGASTGGPEALKSVLLALPAHIPPIVIVQHIPAAFSRALAERLDQLCPFHVKEAADGDRLEPNTVLLAPGGLHMRLEAQGRGYRVRIEEGPPVNGHTPSVDVLFESVAEVARQRAVGILLTGMGVDGARGLLRLRERGAATIAQDEASCVVFGMPRVAIELGAAQRVIPLLNIAEEVTNILAPN